MKFDPRPVHDIPIGELTARMRNHVATGDLVYLKWTCPACGVRVTATDPLTMTPSGQVAVRPGYKHEQEEDETYCGHTVDTLTTKFGCALLMRRI